MPVTVRVKAVLPAVTLAGDMEVVVGTGLVAACADIVNTTTFEVPPPGVALNTVILAVPAVVRSGAFTIAVNCVALTNVVASDEPFQFTTEPLIKFEPVTVSVNAGSPTVALIGAIVVMTGTGFIVPPPPPTESCFEQENPIVKNSITVSNLK